MLTQSENYHLNQRIVFFSRVFGTVLKLCGIVLVIVQVIKSFREGWNLSLLLTSLLGMTLFMMSRQSILVNLISEIFLRRRKPILKVCVFLFPLIFTGLLLYVKWNLGHDSQSWQRMNSEGGLPEYGTSLVYILAAILTYPIGKAFWQKNDKVLGSIYFCLTLLFLFVGLEEISWGQRLIGFSTPEFFETNNVQSEFTFHNLSFFHQNLLHQGYILIGFFGSFGWLLLARMMKQKQNYLIPSWFLASFFLPTLVYYIIHEYTDGFGFFIVEDQESVEFILSLGFLTFVSLNFFRQARELDRETLEKDKTLASFNL